MKRLEDESILHDLWRNRLAKWIAYHLPYSVVSWVLIRVAMHADNKARFDPHRHWSQIIDIWQEQEGTAPWERS